MFSPTPSSSTMFIYQQPLHRHNLCTIIIMLIAIRYRWSCSFMQMFICVHRKIKKYNNYRRKTESVKWSSVIRRLKVTAEFRRKYQKSFDIIVTSYKTEPTGNISEEKEIVAQTRVRQFADTKGAHASRTFSDHVCDLTRNEFKSSRK